jgi:hypothetical protein
MSWQNYDRTVAQVEQVMEQRRKPAEKPKRPRPSFSGPDFMAYDVQEWLSGIVTEKVRRWPCKRSEPL